MAFIKIEFGGGKTYGGALRIDGGAQIRLTDGMIIPVEPGAHYIEFSENHNETLTSAFAMVNQWVGNTPIKGTYRQKGITSKFGTNTVLVITVVSNASGRITSFPLFSINEVTDATIERIKSEYYQQIKRSEAISNNVSSSSVDKANTATTNATDNSLIIELLLCLFLGVWGGHKFYRKKIGLGILYFFTFGLLGVGVFVDFITIVIRLAK